jgi:hypothetical protein
MRRKNAVLSSALLYVSVFLTLIASVRAQDGQTSGGNSACSGGTIEIFTGITTESWDYPGSPGMSVWYRGVTYYKSYIKVNCCGATVGEYKAQICSKITAVDPSYESMEYGNDRCEKSIADAGLQVGKISYNGCSNVKAFQGAHPVWSKETGLRWEKNPVKGTTPSYGQNNSGSKSPGTQRTQSTTNSRQTQTQRSTSNPYNVDSRNWWVQPAVSAGISIISKLKGKPAVQGQSQQPLPTQPQYDWPEAETMPEPKVDERFEDIQLPGGTESQINASEELSVLDEIPMTEGGVDKLDEIVLPSEDSKTSLTDAPIKTADKYAGDKALADALGKASAVSSFNDYEELAKAANYASKAVNGLVVGSKIYDAYTHPDDFSKRANAAIDIYNYASGFIPSVGATMFSGYGSKIANVIVEASGGSIEQLHDVLDGNDIDQGRPFRPIFGWMSNGWIAPSETRGKSWSELREQYGIRKGTVMAFKDWLISEF